MKQIELSEIQDVLRDIFDDENLIITENTTSEDIEAWDSLTHIQLISILSKKYKKELSIEQMGEINSIKKILEVFEDNK